MSKHKFLFNPYFNPMPTSNNTNTSDLFNNIFLQNTNSKVEIPFEAFDYEDKYVIHYYVCCNQDNNPVKKEDIEITIDKGNILCVSFERKPNTIKPLLTNLKYDKVHCNLQLTNLNTINIENVSASYDNGVLIVELKRAPPLNKVVIK